LSGVRIPDVSLQSVGLLYIIWWTDAFFYTKITLLRGISWEIWSTDKYCV